MKKVIDSMTRLNMDASRLVVELEIRGGTDVNGFGLSGDSSSLAEVSRVGCRIVARCVRFVDGADRCASAEEFPGGTFDNRKFSGPKISFEPEIPEEEEMLIVVSERAKSNPRRIQEKGSQGRCVHLDHRGSRPGLRY